MDFIKDFFELNLNKYENFGISFPIGAVLIIFTVAICVSVFLYNYKKIYTASLLKQLIRHNATNEESAKTLKELRLDSSKAIKRALSGSGQLTYLVQSAGEEKPSYEEYLAHSREHGFKDKRINFNEARFFIPHDRIAKAKRTLEASNTEWWHPVLILSILIVILIILAIFLPEILNSINPSVN